jgi:methylenetetrahydrofolate reductase (NADPH)
MRIDRLASSGPTFSFEFFPPKTDARAEPAHGARRAARPGPVVRVRHLRRRRPHQGKTIEIVKRIREQHGLEAMAHFTCVGATVAELRATLDEMGARPRGRPSLNSFWR